MSIFSRKTRRASKVSTPRPRGRLHLEPLEDRSVPSAGMLDPTFGTGGLVRTDLGTTYDRAFDMVIQPTDGKIVTVGDTYNPSSTGQDFAVVRHLANGTLDTSGLGNVQVQVVNLGGTTPGLASGNTIWLDDNAAGRGWFIDTTRADSSEFFRPGNQGEQNPMDLLTVVTHELGHLLQQDHDDEGVMAATLVAGVRNIGLMNEDTQMVDAVFSQFHESEANDFLSALPDEHWVSHRPRPQRRR